jgi:4-hydroxyacetophenone monooxygenase
MVVDNGFYNTIKLPHVDLVTEGIDRITPTGIVTKDGKEVEFDMIALGAGFNVSQYFWPLDYVGTEGMTLQKAWEKDGARSYLGMMMPNYPNLFTFYGPNHQPRGGSLHSFGEKWARYAVGCIVQMIETSAKSVEVKKEVYDEYNERLDAANKNLIWESEGNGYFVNEHGRQSVNMPWTNAEYHTMVAKPNFDDFHVK